MLPAIALVGRPNVGKSTLFNCLTRSRQALVSDFAGMTRDRQYAEGDFEGFRFIAIDTGGLTDEKEGLDHLTAEQSHHAIQEADIVIFVVDARSGLTAADQIIARDLRSCHKPIFLTVNKAEDMEETSALADFFALGFKEVHAVSAAHNRGMDDLVAALRNALPAPEVTPETLEDNTIRLAIIGRPNVGKSTLTNRILGEERVVVSDVPGTTRDSIYIPLQRAGQAYTLIDTAGVRRKGRVFEATEKFSVVKTLQAIDAAQVILMVMDAREGVTEQDLRLLGFILENGKALVLALNKWDDMSEDQKNHARMTLDRRLDFIPYVRTHFISALHGTGVGSVFKSVIEAYTSAGYQLTAGKLNKILQEAVEKHAPPMVAGRRIKLRYAHSGGNFPPCIVIHGNQLDHLPDAYKRYLANTFQGKLKLMGTPVRIDTKNSKNPFSDRKNILTDSQQKKKKRLMRHVKR